jgi:hypothetical protein
MKDGGTAFPVLDGYYKEDGSSQLQNRYFGMSKREYFAGQALGLFKVDEYIHKTVAENIAEQCYTLADAMIAEMEKTNE